MAIKTPTYESLQNDPKFLSAAHHTLNALSIPTSENPQEIVDNFLTHRRYFNTNLGSTIKQGSRIMDLPDQYKQAYAYATDQIDKMPDFGEGSAPLMDGVLDYSIAGVTDPTNLVSILAGAFTAGAGGVAGFAAKEAAKKGIINRLKTAFTKNALKAYAVEGTIAGAGGAAQAARGQEVDIDIGRRKDYDPTQVCCVLVSAPARHDSSTGNKWSKSLMKVHLCHPKPYLFSMQKWSLILIASKIYGLVRRLIWLLDKL